MGESDATAGKNTSISETGAPPASAKELVLQAGLELLDRDGLSLTFDSISYAKVFDYLLNEYDVTVTRGSVHERIWASQDDFRRDVLTESVSYFPPSGLRSALIDPAATSGSIAGFAKDLGSRTFPHLVRSRESGRFQSVKALASWFDDPLATETLHDLLDQRAETALVEVRDGFAATLNRLGLRPKSSLGLTTNQATDLCSVLIGSLTEGARLNYHSGSHDITVPIAFMSTSKDDDEPWRALSIGVKSMMEFLFEPGTVQVNTSDTGPAAKSWKTLKVEPNSHRSDSTSSRRPRAQLRELVLTAAVELLLRDGPQLRPELLNYTSVLTHLKETQGITIHRSSIHPRVWNTNDDFRNEVLTRSLEDNAYPVRAVSDAVLAVQPELSQNRDDDRQRTVREVFRRAGAALPGIEAESFAFRRLLQIKAALVDQERSSVTRDLRVAVANAERQRMDANEAELQAGVLAHGFRPRRETGLTASETSEVFEVLTMTTAAGIMLNRLSGLSAATRTVALRDPDERGDRHEWTPVAVAMRSYFEQLYEEDPD